MFLTPEKSNTSLNMALVKSTFLEKLGVGSTLLEAKEDRGNKFILGFEYLVSNFGTNVWRSLVSLLVLTAVFYLVINRCNLDTETYSILSIIACFKSMLMFLTPEKSNTSLNMALVKSTFLEKLGVGSTL
jgi:hypothetical protein